VRVFKWVSIGLGSLLALVVLGVLVVVWLVDPNRFKPRIEAAVRDATGREFSLVGDIELGFFPWLALRTGEGSFGNAPGFGPEPMVKWRSAQLGARLFPLLRGELVANRVQLEGVDLRLVRHADGHGNWEGIGSAEPAQGESAAGTTVRIDGVEIADSRLSFVDETVPRRVEITGFNLVTDEIARGEPFTDTEISGTLHMDGFAPAGLPFEFDVPRAEYKDQVPNLVVKEFEASFGALEIAGSVQGDTGDAPRFSGRVESNEFDPRALLKVAGIEPPRTTDPQALGELTLAGQWRFDNGAIGIDSLVVTLDETRFTGKFMRAAGEDPVSQIELKGNSLDIGRYVPPPDPASEPFTLPTAMLRSLKVRGTIELDEAKYEDTVMKGVILRLLLDEQGLHSAAQ
jgi:AsmA protein